MLVWDRLDGSVGFGAGAFGLSASSAASAAARSAAREASWGAFVGAFGGLWAEEGAAEGHQRWSESERVQHPDVRCTRSLAAVEKRQSGRGAASGLSSDRRDCVGGIAGLGSGYTAQCERQRPRRGVERSAMMQALMHPDAARCRGARYAQSFFPNSSRHWSSTPPPRRISARNHQPSRTPQIRAPLRTATPATPSPAKNSPAWRPHKPAASPSPTSTASCRR